jgi:hypothetical protein
MFFMAAITVFFAGLLFMKNIQMMPVAAQNEEENKDIQPPAIYNVSATDLTATSAVITWKTDEEADSLVNFGLDTGYGIMREPRFDKKEHLIFLEKLMPGTKYYFRITSSDASGNQGISGDYSFITAEMEKEIPKEGFADFETEKIIESGEGGLKESITENEAVEKIVRLLEYVKSEDAFEKVYEEMIKSAEEEIAPPTIILDYADVQVGVDYAIISWQTDKESNSMVALAAESNYDPYRENPYTWHVGDPVDMVLHHEVLINGLSPATVYHFQVSSESSIGLTGRSTDKTFKTKSIIPEIYNLQVIKVEEESATLRFMTNVPCSSIIHYTNLNTNETKLEGNSSYLTVHSIRLSNLIFDTYYSAIVKVESEEGEEAVSDPVTFLTTKDEYPPAIAKVNTESTIYPGSENKIQTIASWETDEPAQCQLFYHQGLILLNEPDTLPKEEDYGTRHVQVITNFLPSSVYKFWIICNDEAQNEARSDDYTMLTPSQEESIIDIILKNFESSFGWVKKLKM